MPPRITGFPNVSGGASPPSLFATSDTTPATSSVAIFSFKEDLKAGGWVVLESGDSITYSDSSDIITHGGPGAGGMENNFAWFRITDPDAEREYIIQRSIDNTTWLVTLSRIAKFIGGSPTEAIAPTATDGELVISDAIFPADGTYTFSTGVQNAAPWMAYFYGDVSGEVFIGFLHIPAAGGVGTNPTVVIVGIQPFTQFASVISQTNALKNCVALMTGLL